MKKLLPALLALLALTLSPATASAQAKKKEPAKPADSAPAATTPAAPASPAASPEKPAADPGKGAKPARPAPFNTTAEELDATGKAFTHVNADGKKVKFLFTDATVFKAAAAGKKFEDIKLGDAVNGSRMKKNADGTEFEVTTVTFIGVKPAKPSAAKK